MKKEKITFISSVDMENELLENLLRRELDQKFHYMKEWAQVYYDGTNSKDENKLNSDVASEDYYDFFEKNYRLDKNKKIAIISLGCGNASPEKCLLQKLKEKWFDFSYFGVDSSNGMLELAEDNLQELDIEKSFILADFSTKEFKDRIKRLVSGYDQRMYALLGRTFNNPNQTQMADRLYNLLEKEDFIWLDVSTRPDLSAETNLKIHFRYKEYLKNKEEMDSQFYPLKALNLSINMGNIKLESTTEESVGALKFLFSFVFKETQVINFNSSEEIIHLGKGQAISLLHIRIYHLPTLIKFLESFSFKLINSEIKKMEKGLPKAQIMLQK